jgi:hypothetical protein
MTTYNYVFAGKEFFKKLHINNVTYKILDYRNKPCFKGESLETAALNFPVEERKLA